MSLLLFITETELNVLMRSALFRKQCLGDALRNKDLSLTEFKYQKVMDEMDILDDLINNTLVTTIKAKANGK